MNDIVIWRHADAEPGEPDLARKLTQKGHKQAAKMAAWLDKQLPESCRILCSPSLRTIHTVKALGRKYNICDALGPDAKVDAILEECLLYEGKEAVLLVGHQPSLGRLASFLLTGLEQDWTIRKGSIVWLAERRKNQEGEQAKVYLKVVLPAEIL